MPADSISNLHNTINWYFKHVQLDLKAASVSKQSELKFLTAAYKISSKS